MRTMTSKETLVSMLLLCIPLACGLTTSSVKTQKSILATPRQDTDYDIAEAKCLTIWENTGILLHETPEHDWGITCVFDTFNSATACRMIGGYEFRGINPYNGTPGYKLCGVDIHYEDTCAYPFPTDC